MMDATPGIEPGYADLQSAASPLRHVAMLEKSGAGTPSAASSRRAGYTGGLGQGQRFNAPHGLSFPGFLSHSRSGVSKGFPKVFAACCACLLTALAAKVRANRRMR